MDWKTSAIGAAMTAGIVILVLVLLEVSQRRGWGSPVGRIAAALSPASGTQATGTQGAAS